MSNDIHTEGTRAGARLGYLRESGETGDSGEEEDTQWRQVVTLYTRILRPVTDLAYFAYHI